MPKHDDFQLLEIVRPKAQSSKLPNPPKHQITEREKHEAEWLAIMNEPASEDPPQPPEQGAA